MGRIISCSKQLVGVGGSNCTNQLGNSFLSAGTFAISFGVNLLHAFSMSLLVIESSPKSHKSRSILPAELSPSLLMRIAALLRLMRELSWWNKNELVRPSDTRVMEEGLSS